MEAAELREVGDARERWFRGSGAGLDAPGGEGGDAKVRVRGQQWQTCLECSARRLNMKFDSSAMTNPST